jgi:hypothetical protein
MEYLLIMTETADEFAQRDDAGRAGEYWGAWSAFVTALNESGIVRAGAALQPPQTATTVRTRQGEIVVEDGPFADSKEQLGGFFVIEVADLDEALEWARRCPAAVSGAVEVRPVLPMAG